MTYFSTLHFQLISGPNSNYKQSVCVLQMPSAPDIKLLQADSETSSGIQGKVTSPEESRTTVISTRYSKKMPCYKTGCLLRSQCYIDMTILWPWERIPKGHVLGRRDHDCDITFNMNITLVSPQTFLKRSSLHGILIGRYGWTTVYSYLNQAEGK